MLVGGECIEGRFTIKPRPLFYIHPSHPEIPTELSYLFVNNLSLGCNILVLSIISYLIVHIYTKISSIHPQPLSDPVAMNSLSMSSLYLLSYRATQVPH